MEQFITVKTVYPAGPGKKMGAVIDTNEARWGVWASDLSNFAVGSTYKVWDWQVGTWNGKPTQTIKSGQFQFSGNAAPQPPRPQANGSTPRPQGPVGFDDTTRRRDIFVCGALNNILSNPSVDLTMIRDGHQLLEIVWRLRKVFDYGLGPSAQDPNISTAPVGRNATPEQQADASLGYGRVGDMNDEIPF